MKLIKSLTIIVLAVLLTQCYPEGLVYVDEADIVYTNYDPEYDFTAEQTYALPDKIMKIDDKLVQGKDTTFIKDVYATVILERLRKNFKEYGWTETTIDNNPDVLIAPAVYELTTYSYDWWPYYDWWYDPYYPGGGWYYPYPVVSSYSTGTLVVNMVDPTDVSANDRPRVAWVLAINGLLQGSVSNFNARVEKGIDQSFKQSTYLTK